MPDGKSLLRCFLFLLAFCFFLFFSIKTSVLGATLFSTGFESGTLESFWSSSGGGATATVSSELAKSGSYSLKVQHDKTGSYGYQYIIPNLEGGMFYEVSSYGKAASANTASFFIRVAWYSSNDGSGSQLSSPNDSNSGTEGDWLLLTQTIQTPSSANSAKVRLVLNSKTVGQMASAYFDDLVFQEAVAPTPTSTPVPPESPTNTPTPKPPTSTPIPTTAKATPTPASPTISAATPSGEVLAEEVNTSSLTPASSISSPAAEVKAPFFGSHLPQVLIAVGVLFLLISGGSLLLPKIRRYNVKDEEASDLE